MSGATPCVLHFCDTETSKFIKPGEVLEVVELAVVRWTDGNSQALLHEHYIPRHGISDEAARCHGHTIETLTAKGAHKWAGHDCDNITAMLKRQTLAGSNPNFDAQRIAFECERMAKPAPDWNYRMVDTSSVSILMWMQGLVENTKLATLAKYFGLPEQEHTALADCFTAIGVFEAMHDLFVYRPRIMREALDEIAGDDKTDMVLRDFALAAAQGVQL